MTTKRLVASCLIAFVGFAALPTVASAAPHRGHKVCHWERHHHRVCHWVR